jgi:periplasmic copper chaperone A
MLKPAFLAVMLAAATACSAPGPKLSVDDGWARETGPSDTAAAYFTIRNKGGADELTGVRSSVGHAMLHESAMENGVMRMRPIDPREGLVVPSNGRLRLAPGGAHVMITGLKAPLKAGDRFDMTLLFDKARSEKVEITVQPAAAEAPNPR